MSVCRYVCAEEESNTFNMRETHWREANKHITTPSTVSVQRDITLYVQLRVLTMILL